MAKGVSPGQHFFIRTADGITAMAVVEKWEASGRVLVLHEGNQGEHTVSDYLTGMQCSHHKHKTTAKRLAEETMAKAAERVASGEFNWSTHAEINSPEFIAGWKAA
ncbi:hypothetical protein GCM10028803_46420 [Larkinella knui]|uniref:Uncharacterized protein n=1 Tax=Larkinella knui TaxID=2025310 RepID=A0A3P1CPQ0_9BACT|nr:hypothetical protein [Larkinella knui]RRB15235.1 hypothetical protein EHT87_11885 [Larkinella knui]